MNDSLLFFVKNELLAQKTDERIPNPISGACQHAELEIVDFLQKMGE